MEKFILTRNGLYQAQVCSTGTWDEALDFIRSANPAGTENNWFKDEKEGFEPVKCAKYPERTHYAFLC